MSLTIKLAEESKATVFNNTCVCFSLLLVGLT